MHCFHNWELLLFQESIPSRMYRFHNQELRLQFKKLSPRELRTYPIGTFGERYQGRCFDCGTLAASPRDLTGALFVFIPIPPRVLGTAMGDTFPNPDKVPNIETVPSTTQVYLILWVVGFIGFVGLQGLQGLMSFIGFKGFRVSGSVFSSHCGGVGILAQLCLFFSVGLCSAFGVAVVMIRAFFFRALDFRTS